MSESVSILPLLEALERSNASVRLMSSGPEVQFEIWIKEGELVHWQSSPETEFPEELLCSEIAHIWVRPFAAYEAISERQGVKLYEVLKRAHERASQESQNNGTEVLAADVKTATDSAILEDQSQFDAETAPIPSFQPPPPAPPVKPSDGTIKPSVITPKPAPVTKIVSPAKPADPPKPLQPKSDKASESSNKNSDNLIVFVKGKKERKVIGRIEDCDLVIKDSGASRKHCELFFDGKMIHVKDLNSSNGTYLNDKQVHMDIAEEGDVLAIGEASFTFKIDESLVPGVL